MAPGNPLNVVCALIVREGRILAARRDAGGSFPFLWEFPGGKLEDNESAEEALHRELEEELSIQVRIEKALDPVVYEDDSNHIRLLPFVCSIDQAHAPVPVDHIEIRWVDREALQQLTWAPADIPLVERIANDLHHE